MSALIWKLSPWDSEVHGFRELGETTSEAICEHSAPTDKLTEPDDHHRRCMRCLLFHGDHIADHIEQMVKTLVDHRREPIDFLHQAAKEELPWLAG